MKTQEKTKKENTGRAVEVRVAWLGEVQEVAQLEVCRDRPLVYRIGETLVSDFPVLTELLDGMADHPLVASDDKGEVVVRIPLGARGVALGAPGRRFGPGALVLGPDEPLEIEIGPLRFHIAWIDKEPSCAQGMRPDKGTAFFLAASLVLHVAVGTCLWLQPPRPDYLSLDLLDDHNRFVKYMLAPRSATEQVEWLKKESRGSQGTGGGAGRLHMARSSASGMVKSAGILSYAAAGGEPSAVGQDPDNALGSLAGAQVGERFAYGGLGLRGTGRGGSAAGAGTIGLGRLNTIGHGGGGGHGAGYGRGMAALSGAMGKRGAPGVLFDPTRVYWPGHNTEAYDLVEENPFLEVSNRPLSTFSIDVDTAAYANVRRFLANDTPPPRDAVRIEEMVNYFSYDYAPPTGDRPFSAHVETAECPWNADHLLTRIGLKGLEVAREERPPANLVFLIDVSGSMVPVNKLPLLKRSMRMLVRGLNERDRVAMVVYAGSSGLVLPSTPCDQKETIVAALDRLEAGGSTNGGAGIALAYATAEANLIEGGINRVILATDGDFNVGVTSQGELSQLIESQAKGGVFLSVLGFGMGNYKDATLEKLADKGNGNYAYIDTLSEANKVLVEQMGATLMTIAKDVKIQVEFNPLKVGAYRLIGYENRMLKARDFNDDKKDAGEIGAGHTVTALYELVPPDKVDRLKQTVDPLRYQKTGEVTDAAVSDELFTLKLRYKPADGDKSELAVYRVQDAYSRLDDASADFKFAAAVAGFGMILRDSDHKGSATFDEMLDLARNGLGKDRYGYRAEFLEIVRKAKALS